MKIIAQTTSSWSGGEATNVTPITLSPFGDVMKLSFQDSKKYAGILAMPALCKLQEECSIEYMASMMVSEPEKGHRTTPKKATTLDSANDCSVRILVYGVKEEKEAVSQLLSDAGMCLQHPSATEVCRRVDYWNPHYLTRPGSQMPKLETLSIYSDTKGISTPYYMDETQKSHFMQIFNSANGPSDHPSVRSSHRLTAGLKE